MPKAKLTVSNNDLGKLKLATEFCDAKLDAKLTKIGSDAVVTVSARSASDFFKIGRLTAQITDEQVKQAVEEVKAAEKVAKK